VLQPPLGSLNTGSAQPRFTATGVPNGSYRVQVRSVNAAGISSPSNFVDFVVGSAVPCAPPAAPTGVSGSLIAGTGRVTWAAVPGATSYVVVAGSTPGGSDLFNGNVGNATTVSASGLPAGFRAYVRVYAVNACGTSGPSIEVLIS
jgi:predicted phage tail protein